MKIGMADIYEYTRGGITIAAHLKPDAEVSAMHLRRERLAVVFSENGTIHEVSVYLDRAQAEALLAELAAALEHKVEAA